jgi:hypothetical protein
MAGPPTGTLTFLFTLWRIALRTQGEERLERLS